ncbi:MAG TPA: serine/threonine-protein kinase [Polyangiaceae bacterium]|jgi:serine/threonine protein kinase
MTTPKLAPPDDPLAARAAERVGTVLQDKWTLDALLGVGGMAAVYSATHRNGKRVAVKVLHAEMGRDAEVKQRFLQEGYAANTIQHEGAVSVMDDDVAPDGSAFIVMELLEGETVESRWVRSGQRLPVREVLAVVEQLLDVLAAAHAKNVVHRDVKPENLFITKVGQLKVLDFGIAKVFEAAQGRQTATRAGMVMGTPAFMAPEQARARWDEVDGRTDLWAVGAMMFTLLTGRHVHEGVTGNEQLILSATTPAPSLGSVAAEVPPALVAIVDRALAFERGRRWPDAASMQQAVRGAMAALGEGDLLVPASSRRPATSTVLSGVVTQARPVTSPGAATMIDTTGTASALAAWAKERETRTIEASKLRASIADLTQQFGAAKKRVAEAQATVDAARTERSSLGTWMERQVGTRTAAVDEARKLTRGKLVGIARQAIADRTAFGPEHDGAREQLARLERAAGAAGRDVKVHAAALEAYDARSLRLGVLLMGVAAALLLALIVIPVVWRATRVIDAPPPGTVPAAPARTR